MAEVFRARLGGVAGFEKILVIKRILPHLGRNDRFVQMFVNEAQLAAMLQHQNIVQVYELGQLDSGELYIAMEYVPGIDLRGALRSAAQRVLRIPIWFSLHTVSEVLGGLSHAHELTGPDGSDLHVVHRDVTPSNVFVSSTGEVKLADFGIAKAAGQVNETRSGQLKGKISYMPPEQLHGQPLDARADVFAAGVVLWECLTQRRLFGGRPEFETMLAICEGPRDPPSRYNPKVPPELDEVTLHALIPDREQRIGSARELQARLLEILVDIRPRLLPSEIKHVVDVLTGKKEPDPALGADLPERRGRERPRTETGESSELPSRSYAEGVPPVSVPPHPSMVPTPAGYGMGAWPGAPVPGPYGPWPGAPMMWPQPPGGHIPTADVPPMYAPGYPTGSGTLPPIAVPPLGMGPGYPMPGYPPAELPPLGAEGGGRVRTPGPEPGSEPPPYAKSNPALPSLPPLSGDLPFLPGTEDLGRPPPPEPGVRVGSGLGLPSTGTGASRTPPEGLSRPPTGSHPSPYPGGLPMPGASGLPVPAPASVPPPPAAVAAPAPPPPSPPPEPAIGAWSTAMPPSAVDAVPLSDGVWGPPPEALPAGALLDPHTGRPIGEEPVRPRSGAVSFDFDESGTAQIVDEDPGALAQYSGPFPFFVRNADGRVVGPFSYEEMVRAADPRHSDNPATAPVAVSTDGRAWCDLATFGAQAGLDFLAPDNSPLSNVVFVTKLEQRSLVQILARLARAQRTGRLVIMESGVGRSVARREIDILRGAPTFVYADRRDLQLPDLLVRREAIAGAVMPELIHNVLAHREALEDLATRAGLGAMARYRPVVMRDRLAEIATWRRGKVAFDEGILPRVTKPFATSLLSVLVDAVSRAWSADELAALLEPRRSAKLSRAERFDELLSMMELDKAQETAARRLADGKTLAQLVKKYPNDAATHHLMAYVLLESDALIAPLD
jgi:serine/threonine protein kinase